MNNNREMEEGNMTNGSHLIKGHTLLKIQRLEITKDTRYHIIPVQNPKPPNLHFIKVLDITSKVKMKK